MKKLDKTLVIGIGNNMRQDDGLGWNFLELLETEGFNADNLLQKYQLMVEDAELISGFDAVFFVDACKSELENGFALERIYPAEDISFSTHSVPPNQILNLCEALYTKKPKSYLLKIQGCNWDIGIGFSELAETNLKNAFSYFLENTFASERF